MILGQIAIISLFYIIIPIIVGYVMNIQGGINKYLVGIATLMAIFQLECIPAAFIGISLTKLSIIYLITIGILILILFSRKNNKKRRGVKSLRYIKQYLNVYFIIALIVILTQMVRIFFTMPHIYGDDNTYISLINDMESLNAIYPLDPLSGEAVSILEISHKYLWTSYYPYLSMICLLGNIKALILCKTILPSIYILMSYLVVWEIGKHLFESSTKKSIFILIYAILIETGNYSYYTISRRVLMYTWNSKSFLFIVLLPLLFLYIHSAMSAEYQVKNYIIVSIIGLSCAAATLMGTAMSVIMMGLLGLYYSFVNKQMKYLIRMVCASLPSVVFFLLDVLYAKGGIL